ncbi:hypothetical protein BGW38_003079 [Lunasporangiospora selenospora]|uniref:Chromosome transmission fidelity protein 8 n=1 Tax=Lunasporangiospora selenospora TaxID=979761 RepID=A0A9P6KHL8_9FUNG|nr:hypothetical protein BGW38_003079 [Lunasporangiospora selenospora]
MVVITIPTRVTELSAGTAFARRIDTNATILLDLQGAIEMDGLTWAGNTLGQLSILDGGVKAQLVIGNHRLDGKVIKLAKPLLLIQKQKKEKNTDQDQDTSESTATTSQTSNHQPESIHSARKEGRGRGDNSDDDDDDTMHMNVDSDTAATGTTSANVAPMTSSSVDLDPLAPNNIRDPVDYNTVAIIREKILFNSMPVPIIHVERRGLTVIKRGF